MEGELDVLCEDLKQVIRLQRGNDEFVQDLRELVMKYQRVNVRFDSSECSMDADLYQSWDEDKKAVHFQSILTYNREDMVPCPYCAFVFNRQVLIHEHIHPCAALFHDLIEENQLQLPNGKIFPAPYHQITNQEGLTYLTHGDEYELPKEFNKVYIVLSWLHEQNQKRNFVQASAFLFGNYQLESLIYTSQKRTRGCSYDSLGNLSSDIITCDLNQLGERGIDLISFIANSPTRTPLSDFQQVSLTLVWKSKEVLRVICPKEPFKACCLGRLYRVDSTWRLRASYMMLDGTQPRKLEEYKLVPMLATEELSLFPTFLRVEFLKVDYLKTTKNPSISVNFVEKGLLRGEKHITKSVSLNLGESAKLLVKRRFFYDAGTRTFFKVKFIDDNKKNRYLFSTIHLWNLARQQNIKDNAIPLPDQTFYMQLGTVTLRLSYTDGYFFNDATQ